jgi:hypothetical protein
MLGFGAIGALILLLGLGLFLYFEPIDEQAGNTNARITGVYAYDQATGERISTTPTARYRPRQVPGAVVDWKSVPADMVVSAHWYDDHGQVLGGVGPAAAASQPANPIPIDVDTTTVIPPGAYVFVVERYSGGRPVQVLARAPIKVDGA